MIMGFTFCGELAHIGHCSNIAARQLMMTMLIVVVVVAVIVGYDVAVVVRLDRMKPRCLCWNWYCG